MMFVSEKQKRKLTTKVQIPKQKKPKKEPAKKIKIANVHSVNPEEKKFLCIFCGYSCKRSASLKEHISRMHTGEKNYACSECPKRFVKSNELKNHMRQHTGEKPYSCNQCDYKCAYSRSLVDHMCLHTGLLPHKCNVPGCEYMCANLSTLKKHTRSHTGDLPFPCELCSYKVIHHVLVEKSQNPMGSVLTH